MPDGTSETTLISLSRSMPTLSEDFDPTDLYLYDEVSVHSDEDLDLEDDVHSLEIIEELLGSSLESLEGNNTFQSPTSSNMNPTELLILKLEDSPKTRRRKLLAEADELVSEEEEDDINSEHDCYFYEEMECELECQSNGSSANDEYDDITDEEDVDADADSGEYFYEEIILPDHITPIQKNWANSWFFSIHRRRLEQISEGEEESCDSDGSISLKDGKRVTRNDLDKSWGSLDGHLRSLHSHRTSSPTRVPTTLPSPTLIEIEALLPVKSPRAKRDRTRRMAPSQNAEGCENDSTWQHQDKQHPHQQHDQKQKLVQIKEAEEEQELNDSLRVRGRTAFLKAKKKSKTKETQRKPNTTKQKKGGNSKKKPTRSKECEVVPGTVNVVEIDPTRYSGSGSKSKRKNTVQADTGSCPSDSTEQTTKALPNHKTSLAPDGAVTDNSTRSKSKSKRKSKGESDLGGREGDKSDKSNSKSRRKLKVDAEKTQGEDFTGNTSSIRSKSKSSRQLLEGKDLSESSPLKRKKKSKSKPKSKQIISLDTKSDDKTIGSEKDGDENVQSSPSVKEDHSLVTQSNSGLFTKEAISSPKQPSKLDAKDHAMHILRPPLLDVADETSKINRSSKKERSKSPKTRKSVPILQLTNSTSTDTTKHNDSTSKLCQSPEEKNSSSRAHKSNSSLLSTCHDNKEVASPPIQSPNISRSKSPKVTKKSTIKPHSMQNLGTFKDLAVDAAHQTPSKRTRSLSPKRKKKSTKNRFPIDNTCASKSCDNDDSSLRSASSKKKPRSKSLNSRKSHEKPQSMNDLLTAKNSPSSNVSPKSNLLGSKRRGGKRPNIDPPCESQALPFFKDRNDTTSKVNSRLHRSLSPFPRKSKLMIEVSEMNSLTKDHTDDLEPTFVLDSQDSATQFDKSFDSRADTERLNSTRNLGSILLSPLSWKERQSTKKTVKLSFFSRGSKCVDSENRVAGEGEDEKGNVTETPSKRRTDFLRSILSPISRSKSLSKKQKETTHSNDFELETSNNKTPLLQACNGMTNNRNPSQENTEFAEVNESVDESPSNLSKDSQWTVELGPENQVSLNCNVTDPTSTIVGTDGKIMHEPPTHFVTTGSPSVENENRSNGQVDVSEKTSTSVSPCCTQDDSTTTHKTSTMSLSLEEDNSLKENRSEIEAKIRKEELQDETSMEEQDTKPTSQRNCISGKIQREPNCYRVESTKWKSVLS